LVTEKVCARCGKHCVPAQSYCPKCGSALPAATPGLAPSGSPHKLILNRGGEEQILELEDIEQALNEALPWVMKGYIARITDKQGVVKYTQALSRGQIATYPGDATEQPPGPGAHVVSGSQSMAAPRKPWWRFW